MLLKVLHNFIRAGLGDERRGAGGTTGEAMGGGEARGR